MNSKSREELVEQYEDAAFALLMSEYAEQEGNRLLREFEDAKARGEVPEVPAALDAKCRKMIRQAYDKKRRENKVNAFLRTAVRTAAMLFITLGVCTTLVFSVEALRTPVINFLIEQNEWFTSIDFDKEMTDTPMQDINSTASGDTSPVDALIPTDYELYNYTVRDDGSVVIIYVSEENSIFFSITALEGNLNLDTENAEYKNVMIAGYEGTFVNKDDVFTIMWYDLNNEKVFQLRADGLANVEFWVLAESIAELNVGG